MARHWTKVLAVLLLVGLAGGGACYLKWTPPRGWVWVARQPLDADTPLDSVALMRQRMTLDDGRIPATEDLSNRTVKHPVAKDTPLTWDDLAALVEVVRAVQPIDRGTPFEPGMFERQRLPPSQVLSGAIRTLDKLEGRAASIDLKVGDQVPEKVLLDLIQVPVPTATVKRGQFVPELGRRAFLPADVPATAILTASLAVGRLAVTNLYQNRPILAAEVCDYAWAPVPATAIAAGSTLTTGSVHLEPLCVARITSHSVLTLTALTGKLAVTNLSAHEPIEREAVDDPLEVWVPTRPITAGTTIGGGDLVKVTVGAREVTASTAVDRQQIAGMIAARLLLPGKPVQQDALKSPPAAPSYWGTLELTVSDNGAQSGALRPGDLVDLYATARLVTDQEGSPISLDVPAIASAFPVRGVRLVEIEKLGEGFRVRLQVPSQAGVAAIVQAAPRVEFYLVSH